MDELDLSDLRPGLLQEIRGGAADGSVRAVVAGPGPLHTTACKYADESQTRTVSLEEYASLPGAPCAECWSAVSFSAPGAEKYSLARLDHQRRVLVRERERVEELVGQMERGDLAAILTSDVGDLKDRRKVLAEVVRSAERSGPVWAAGYAALTTRAESAAWDLRNPEGWERVGSVLARDLVPSVKGSAVSKQAVRAARRALVSEPGLALVSVKMRSSLRTETVLWEALDSAYSNAGRVFCGPPVLVAWLESRWYARDVHPVKKQPTPEVLEAVAALHEDGGQYSSLKVALRAARALG